MSGNSKRIPKKKPDHESGFYEEYPAENERRTRSSNSINVNSRTTSEDFPTKMKKTIKNVKNNRKKSDIIPPNGFSMPDNKIEERKLPPITPAIDDFVLILSDGEEEEAAALTSNGSNSKENLKTVRPVESEKPKPPVADKNEESTVTNSYSQSDKELEQISRIKKYGGMSIFFISFFRISLKNLFMILWKWLHIIHMFVYLLAMLW